MPEIKQSYYLQQALNFTDVDLKANRAGKLSSVQSKRIQRTYIPMLFVSVLISGIMPVVLILQQRTFEAGILSIPLFFILFFVLRAISRLYDDLNNSVVNNIAFLQRYDRGATYREPYRNYFLWISQKDRELSIPRELFPVLKSTEVYTVYYLPRLKILLSIEIASRETAIHELKGELKYLESQQASLKAKKGKR